MRVHLIFKSTRFTFSFQFWPSRRPGPGRRPRGPGRRWSSTASSPWTSPRTRFRGGCATSLANVARMYPFFSNCGGLVLGCIKADFCNPIFIVQHFFELYNVWSYVHTFALLQAKNVCNMSAQNYQCSTLLKFQHIFVKYHNIFRDVTKFNMYTNVGNSYFWKINTMVL